MNACKWYRDVGVAYTAGVGRSNHMLVKRFKATTTRRKRAARLASTFRGARLLGFQSPSCFSLKELLQPLQEVKPGVSVDSCP